ncbi:hypothetical protein [Clostridium minihomine]|uniref:hypothetical protein n=1 Tax=Clostridium minihomine TaxID=2045012 RepID=UPI000C78A0FD|nr:hypothetical protein [Clostridium minihomine]
MSQQIILAQGTVIDVAVVNGQSIYYQGVQRDSLEIQIAKDSISFDELDKLTADMANTDRLTLITLEGDQKSQSVLEHYIIRTKLELKPITILSSNGESTDETIERYSVTLAQLTYQEQQVKQMADEIADAQKAIAALAFGGVK